MARPKPTIITAIEIPSGERWELLKAEKTYVITYRNEPVNIRAVTQGLGIETRKYKKLSYTNRGNCIAQVRRLNNVFGTEDFGYIEFPT